MDRLQTERRLPLDSDDVFAANLPVIEHAIAVVARRRCLSADEREDFTGTVMLRLLENDRAILRKFEGRSSLHTFLVVAIDRILLDQRVSRWGKWRPSAKARRLGRVALLLERLVFRDSLSLTEACEVLRVSYGEATSIHELEALFARLPARRPRRVVGEWALENLAGSSESPVVNLLRPHAARTATAFGRCVARLSFEERSLIRLRFSEGRSIADIARSMQVDQKALYGRFQRLFAKLKVNLAEQGILATDVLSWLGQIDLPSAASWPRTARATTPRLPPATCGPARHIGKRPTTERAAASVA